MKTRKQFKQKDSQLSVTAQSDQCTAIDTHVHWSWSVPYDNTY